MFIEIVYKIYFNHPKPNLKLNFLALFFILHEFKIVSCSKSREYNLIWLNDMITDVFSESLAILKR